MTSAYFRRAKSFCFDATFILATVMLFAFAITTVAHGQTLTTLYNFGAPGGPGSPGATFAQGRDGNLYGTSSAGGSYGHGTVFKITTSGSLKVLHNFDGARGYFPAGGLTLATNGNFYGTTMPDPGFDCKDTGCGTVFKIESGGKLTFIYNFNGTTDLSTPVAPPIEASDGNFYGTARGSGPWPQYHPGGIYKMTPSGEMTRLYIMAADAPLLQATNGNFYATASVEDYNWDGSLAEITPTGQQVFLFLFGFPFSIPQGPLIEWVDGNMYGTLQSTAYKVSPTGVFGMLHDFTPELQTMGGPAGPLILASDGNFYGLTYYDNYPQPYSGAIYRIDPSHRSFSWLFHFDTLAGAHPTGPLFQHTNGLFYGVTAGDGTYGTGTFFSFDVGLPPFARLVSTSGQVGKKIGILGQGFTGTTNVSFNGVSATFTAVSDKFLNAYVPDGALTGSVTVTSPTGTLTSNLPFRVTPKIFSFNPTSGASGTPVVITGSGLIQASEVRFTGGADATNFTVYSDTQVTVIVPTNAQTGRIAIKTPGGIVTSAGTFTVTP